MIYGICASIFHWILFHIALSELWFTYFLFIIYLVGLLILFPCIWIYINLLFISFFFFDQFFKLLYFFKHLFIFLLLNYNFSYSHFPFSFLIFESLFKFCILLNKLSIFIIDSLGNWSDKLKIMLQLIFSLLQISFLISFKWLLLLDFFLHFIFNI